MLALCIGVPCWFFATAHAGLLWEEREPALFVYFSDRSACPLFLSHQCFCILRYVGALDTDLGKLMVAHVREGGQHPGHLKGFQCGMCFGPNPRQYRNKAMRHL